jgi:alkylation response protein AidB-like acyl-CoA dehydrogenase
VRSPGGYQVGGKFSFGSGCAHADWFGAGMLLLVDGKPQPLPNGVPEVRVSWVPRDKVEVLGNWEVSGLVGTGSYDYRVQDQEVAESFTFERGTTTPLRGGPLLSVGLATLGGIGHSAVVLGLMRRALAEIATIAATRKRPGYAGVIGEQDLFKHDFVVQEAAYQASRDYVLRVFREVEATASSGQRVSALQSARMRQATTWVHKVAAEVIQFCHLWAGSEAIRLSSAMTRVSRDMGVATQHVIVDPRSLIDAAPALLEAWRAAQPAKA